MKYVKIQFKEGDYLSKKEYFYLNDKNLDVKVGDIVTVDARGEIALAQVSGLTDLNTSGMNIYKTILNVVDLEKAQADQDKANRRLELKSTIEVRTNSLEWELKVRDIASKAGDLELIELLEEYITL